MANDEAKQAVESVAEKRLAALEIAKLALRQYRDLGRIGKYPAQFALSRIQELEQEIE